MVPMSANSGPSTSRWIAWLISSVPAKRNRVGSIIFRSVSSAMPSPPSEAAPDDSQRLDAFTQSAAWRWQSSQVSWARVTASDIPAPPIIVVIGFDCPLGSRKRRPASIQASKNGLPVRVTSDMAPPHSAAS